MSRRSFNRRYDDSDEDDYEPPVYQGSRNYDGFGAAMTDAFNDMAVSVKKVATKFVEETKRKEIMSNVQSKVNEAGEAVEKAKKDAAKALEQAMRKDERGTNTSGMPEGCFCDMRGFACPKHRGREKWRCERVYQQHIRHNVDGEAAAEGAPSAAAESGNGAAQAERLKADEDMAKLIAMGFDPQRVARALEVSDGSVPASPSFFCP